MTLSPLGLEIKARLAEIDFPGNATKPISDWLYGPPGDILFYYTGGDIPIVDVLNSHGKSLNEIFKS